MQRLIDARWHTTECNQLAEPKTDMRTTWHGIMQPNPNVLSGCLQLKARCPEGSSWLGDKNTQLASLARRFGVAATDAWLKNEHSSIFSSMFDMNWYEIYVGVWRTLENIIFSYFFIFFTSQRCRVQLVFGSNRCSKGAQRRSSQLHRVHLRDFPTRSENYPFDCLKRHILAKRFWRYN